MQLQDIKKAKLPDAPGVYFFKKGRHILYIGKATSLKDRVRSYFSNDLLKTRGLLIMDMVTQATDIDFIKTDSVLEALILEANLIKKHQPIANTKEKDNKSYNFVVFTKEEFPRVLIERGRVIEFMDSRLRGNDSYDSIFGPFPSQQQLREALKIIRKIFPFKTDASDSRLYKQLGLEPNLDPGSSPGSLKEAKLRYKNNLRHIKLFFQGKKKELIKQLEKEMKVLAKEELFEQAAKVRNQIFALEHIRDVSLIKGESTRLPELVSGSYRIEAYDAAHMSGKNSVGVMTVIEDGEVKKYDYRKFILRKAGRGDDVASLEEILSRRLKHVEWQYPDLIIVDGGLGQRNRAVKVLKELHIKIPVVGVVKDERHKPKSFLGPKQLIEQHKKEILLANSEAHRFAISFYRSKQRKTSLSS